MVQLLKALIRPTGLIPSSFPNGTTPLRSEVIGSAVAVLHAIRAEYRLTPHLMHTFLLIPTGSPMRQVIGLLLMLLFNCSAFAQAPTVTGLSPARNARSANRSADVTVTFDQAMSTGSGTQQALRVFGSLAGGRKAGAATVSGGTLSFNPTADFKPGETVWATLTTAAQSSAGSALAQPHVFQFTAGAGPGPGTFSGGSETVVGAAPFSISHGDIDGDGDLDLVTANFSANTVSVRVNDGSGNFSGTQEVVVGASPFSISLGDIDADGDLDFLCANLFGGTVSVRFNNGAGGFSGTQDLNTGTRPSGTTLGDVDGDGDLDLVCANMDSNSVTVHLNNGSGVFGSGASLAIAGINRPLDAKFGDVDSDGDLDVLFANFGSGEVSVCLNNGQGSFTLKQHVPCGNSSYNLALGDVDADGDLDLLCANYGSSTVSVRFNDGSGSFAGGTDVPVLSQPYSVVLADGDGDGDLDFFVGNGGQGIYVKVNNGAGSFSGTQLVATGADHEGNDAMALGDLDGDLDLDLLAANAAESTVSVRFNQTPISITSLSPTSGAVGASIVIAGANLVGASQVTFNGVDAPAFVVNSATQITVSVPAGATSGPVVVTKGGASSNALPFTVLNCVVTAVAQNVTVLLDANGQATVAAGQVNDGSAATCGIASLQVAPANFTCTNLGPNNVTLTVTDANGNTATTTAVVTVTDATAPSIAAPAALTLSTDPGSCSRSLANTQLGSPVLTDNCAGATASHNAPASFSSGTTTVTWTVTDAAGNQATATQTVTIVDQAPPTVIAQNVTVILPFTGTSAVTASQVNNGSYDNCTAATGLTLLLSRTAFDCSHVGANSVTLTVTDASGNMATQAVTVTVVNAEPVILSVTGPTAPINIAAATAALTANVTDDNLVSASWDWDDGTPATAGGITGASLTGAHTYTTPGVYRPSVTVQDACGRTATSVYEYVVVYDSNGGFITGGGWITSPVNTALPYMQVGGRANFGFVAKYQQGSTQVNGNTEFNFHAANLNFQSNSYDEMRLVISGSRASYKGKGKINGTGNYGFMVSAVDGQQNGGGGTDKFRIKIWAVASGAIVYDNQAGDGEDAPASTSIGGGAIVIHNGGGNGNSGNTASRSGEPSPQIISSVPAAAYPNPFHDQVTVAFVFEQEEQYRVDIFDARGRLVERLLNPSTAPAGAVVQATWAPKEKASGVYVLRLTTPTRVQNIRLVCE